MSEYQCYEFVALDRPLTAKDMSELRAISTRAEISPTRFWNEYQWGNLKADPSKLLTRYFDAFLYFANWGTRRFMLRLPADRIDLRRLRAYFPGDSATLTRVRKYVVIDLWSDDDEPEEDWFEGGRLGALTPIRAQLLGADMSAAYLAWLLAVQSDELSGSSKEPAVPAGLRDLSAPLSAFVDFLRIDEDLVAAAKEASDDTDVDPTALRNWVTSQPVRIKNQWLARAVEDPNLPIGPDLLAAFRRQRPSKPKSRRTVSQLLARTEELRLEREQAEEKRAAAARRRAQTARKKHLAALSREGEKVWRRLERLVVGREYDEAVELTIDLHDLLFSADRQNDFDKHLTSLRKKHPRRRGYWDSVKRQLDLQWGELNR